MSQSHTGSGAVSKRYSASLSALCGLPSTAAPEPMADCSAPFDEKRDSPKLVSGVAKPRDVTHVSSSVRIDGVRAPDVQVSLPVAKGDALGRVESPPSSVAT